MNIKKMNIKMKYLLGAVLPLLILLLMAGCAAPAVDEEQHDNRNGLLSSTEDIGLHETGGGDTNYAFTYDGEEFRVLYYYDNWTIYDSYKITNEDDMAIICQALIDEQPIHGRDLESYRTADDMVYEWEQHNLAYAYLPEDNSWRESAKNVDFDPEDQGRSFEEIYEDRTGKEFDLEEYIKRKLDDGDLMEQIGNLLQ